MNTDILFSIVIPVKNGDQWLEQLLQTLMNQSLIGRSEIIVIDSGSTDKSLDIVRRYPARLIQIPSSEFNHGATRNLGVAEAKGKYVVMTVQDAVPASPQWLQYFLDGFVDEKVAGVCGRQITPHDQDKNPVRWYRFFSPPALSFVHFDDPEDFLRLSPAAQRQACGWDNVSAAYRRDILLQHPFATTDFAEDILWAKELLLKGHTLAYNGHAMAFHYHHQVPEFVLPRYFSVYYFEYRLFGVKPRPEWSVLKYSLVTVRILIRESSIPWRQKIKWFFFNIRYRLALQKTIGIFNGALKKGENFLDVRYREICNSAPQAPKY